MLKVILHKGLSIVMAFVVLFSTFSFTVEKHYCGNHLVDTAIFTKARKCGMEAVNSANATIQKKSCCKDEIEIIKGQDELKLNTFNDLEYNQQLILTSFVYSYFQIYESLPKQIIPHQFYSPPNLIVDFQVLHDVYII